MVDRKSKAVRPVVIDKEFIFKLNIQLFLTTVATHYQECLLGS